MKRRVLIGIATVLVVALVAVVAFAIVGPRPARLPSAVASVSGVSLQPGRTFSLALKPEKSPAGGVALRGPEAPAGRRIEKQQPVRASVTLRYAAGTSDTTKRALASSLGLRVTHEFPGGWTVVESTLPGATSASLAQAIKASGAVAIAAPTPRVTPTALPNDPEFKYQWDLSNTGQLVGGTSGISGADIGWIGAWNRASTGAGVIVAVTDTGADFQHEDLASQMWANPSPGSDPAYPGDVHGWDFLNRDGLTFKPWDGDEHGTHVSGTIAAATNNGVGIAGIASGARIMSLRFMGPAGGLEDDAAEAVYYAVAHGAKVINASWGDKDYTGPYQPLRDAIHAAAQQGVLFVAAAGNDATTTLFYPAAYSLVETNVIAVAATDNRDALASFSNRGTYPQIAAPGVNTLSTYPPLQAGVFVDKAPFKVSYLAFPVEAIISSTDRDGVVDSAMGALTADKSAPVLVVDDSRVDLTGETQGTRLQPYLTALADDGYTNVTTWITATQDVPSAEKMSGHTVVWFTGSLDSASYNFPNVGTLNAADRVQIGSFLDGGGRLFLSSASVAWDLTPGPIAPGNTTIADSAWLTKYLRVTLVSNAFVAVVDGRPETSFAGISPVLSDPLVNISYCDAVLPADTVAVRTMDWAGYGYGAMSGTSMAAPHVTGVVALLTQRFPGITGGQVKDRILATVKSLPLLAGKVTTGGRLDASAALAPYAAQVTAFTGTPSLDGTVTLAWTNPADVAWDRTVIRGRAGADPSGPADSESRLVYSGTGTTIDDTGLPGGTQMHYMAYAHSTTGLWSDGVAVIVAIAAPPPGPVTGLSGWWAGSAVHLSWTNPTVGFLGTRVVRSSTAIPVTPTDGTLLGDTAGTTFDDTSVAPGATAITYHYAVFAHDAVPQYSSGTVVDVVVPKDVVPPAAPSAISALAGDLKVDLSWSNPPDADFALTRVLRSTTGFATDPATSAVQTQAYSGTGTSVTDGPTLTNGTTYYYTLFAQDTAGNWSVASTVAAIPVPDPVTGATGVWQPGTLTVHLAWTNPGGSATGVLIVRNTLSTPANATDGTVVGDVSAQSSYEDSFSPGATDLTYHYALFAHDGTPVCATGVPVDVVVPRDMVPPGPVIAAHVTGMPTQTSITLGWTNPADADFVRTRVLRSTVGYSADDAFSSTQTILSIVMAPNSTLSDTGLTAGTLYYYTLFARDLASNRSAATQVSAATAPDPVSAFKAVPDLGAGVVHLNWTDPAGNPAFAGVLIVRRAGAIPLSPSDGSIVGTALPGAGRLDDLKPPAPEIADKTYHYAAFPFSTPLAYGPVASQQLLVSRDATPPLPPDHLKAAASDGMIVLTWNNPKADFTALAVKESTSSFATTAAVTEPQQAVVLSDFTKTTTTRTGLTNGQTYYYTFFAMDAVGNWSTAATVAATPMAGQPVYRFYNMRAGVHFYTASPAERENVINTLWSVYRFEGPAYTVNPANAFNTQDLYRFYNFKAGVHFYTANAAERDQVINTLGGVYHYEGPAYRVSLVSDATTFPVYRFYNFKAGVHFYTASEDEKTNVLNTLGGVYRFEGVAYYVGK